MKKKNIIFIVIFMIVVGLCCIAIFGIHNEKNRHDGLPEKNEINNEISKTKTDNQNENEENEKEDIEIMGGSVISFEVDKENEYYRDEMLTEENMDIVEEIFETRLNNAGITEAKITREGLGQITVEIPSVFNTDEAVSLLGSTAKLTFVNADGEVILDGVTDIKDASYKYEVVTSDTLEHYVELVLTPQAVKKFALATKAASQAEVGKNYIAIVMDGTVISMPYVSEEINSEVCIITGDFTEKTAKEFVNQLKSGALPLSLKVMSTYTIDAELE